MERLTSSQQEAISKMGTARLVVKLVKAGFSEAELEKMDRPALMAAWAECVASGKDAPAPVPSKTFSYRAELERQNLHLKCAVLRRSKKSLNDRKNSMLMT